MYVQTRMYIHVYVHVHTFIHIHVQITCIHISYLAKFSARILGLPAREGRVRRLLGTSGRALYPSVVYALCVCVCVCVRGRERVSMRMYECVKVADF